MISGILELVGLMSCVLHYSLCIPIIPCSDDESRTFESEGTKPDLFDDNDEERDGVEQDMTAIPVKDSSGITSYRTLLNIYIQL